MTVTEAFDDFPTSETLLATVEGDDEFYQSGIDAIKRLEHDEPLTKPDTLSFPSVEELFKTFTPQTMALLETISDAGPESIRETARLAGRDVKNVHQELTELEQLGVIRFETDGRAKRPVFPYEELVISLPFDHDRAHDTARA